MSCRRIRKIVSSGPLEYLSGSLCKYWLTVVASISMVLNLLLKFGNVLSLLLV